MDLRLATRRAGDDTVVSARGEIDNLTAPALRDALVSALDAGTRRLIVDLSDTDFLDSSGLGALVGANKHAQRSSSVVAIVCPKPHLRRLFEISRLDAVLPVYESMDALTAP